MEIELQGGLGFVSNELTIGLTPKGIVFTKLPHKKGEEDFDMESFTEQTEFVVHVLLKFIENIVRAHVHASDVYYGKEDIFEYANSESEGN